ncbi:MAG: phosphoribosylamine--glycine ligase, partial [Candidatus Eremiobacteraeota bacterium]|nr:phosphoribosylamine--glycine ligase [Candidatus Eremiobacteraeota bacterium]
MKVLVIGSGGREDALSWRLARSPSCSSVAACPGNAGTASRGANWEDLVATDGKGIAERSRREGIDLAVIGPETAIAAGVADHLRSAGIATFGPSRSAGRLETSKVFAKRFMERHGIPTASAQVVHSLQAAKKVLAEWDGACVVKADGLASGKGVVVVDSAREAEDLLQRWFGDEGVPGGGREVLLEECLTGREVSVFALGDGSSFRIFGSACDYKRASDGDTGPNTGGMGAYSPPTDFPREFVDVIHSRILEPLLRGLSAERERYVGVIYCGLMWTAHGPYVIEFNVRFGDPETQVLMPRVRGDFAQLLAAIANGSPDRPGVDLDDQSCVGVVLATADYPRTSTPLEGLTNDLALSHGCAAFWGASRLNGSFITASGGRVLTVTALGADVTTARHSAYAAVDTVTQRFGKDRPLRFRR